MKKALLSIPVSLYFVLSSCSHPTANVHIGGGVSAFVQDSVAFNKEFGNEMMICNFSFNGLNDSRDMFDPSPVTDAHSARFSKLMAHTKKEDLTMAIITTSTLTDSVAIKGFADKVVAYIKKDSLFTGFKKYTVNIAPDGAPVATYTY
ncbi:hypothetical protein [Chitinophaga sp.]|uniref:hypothetical protein n=1 Tax=Chitinophaga sp. TaxID=1869181 RepID=UPI002F945173